MSSLQAVAMRQFIRLTLKPKKLDSVEKIRTMVAGIKSKPHSSVCIKPTVVNGLDAEWLLPPTAMRDAVILYLHGGGYVSGSLDTHRGVASQIAYHSRIPVLCLDYRLAPEHPFPSSICDVIDAYQWLLNMGFKSRNIMIAGDSAGGGLTLASLLKMRDDQMPMPAGAMCISPLTDMLATGNSVKTRANVDPWLKPLDIAIPAEAYAQDIDLEHPYISPLYGNLVGLPPIMIQVGDHEILLSDSTRFAQKAEIAGVDVDLRVWEGMWHVWHVFYDMVPESQQAIQEIADFARQHVGIPHQLQVIRNYRTNRELERLLA